MDGGIPSADEESVAEPKGNSAESFGPETFGAQDDGAFSAITNTISPFGGWAS
jgi:hypothetical protein